MAEITVLRNEIVNDPLGRGYAGMTDSQVADSLNTANRNRNRSRMEATEVFNAVNKAEYNALLVTSKELFWNVLHLGQLNPFGLEAAIFVDIFGAGSTTISTLQGLRTESISRAEELGLPRIKVGLVQMARAG